MLARYFVVCALIALLGTTEIISQEIGAQANGPALFEKGMNGLQGSVFNRNPTGVVEDFRRSAELGYAPAQVVLGYMYDAALIVNKEPRQAADWYKKAAAQGDPLGAWLLGRVIYRGLVPPYGVNDAIPWLKQASESDNPFAEHLLALIYIGKQDFSKAADLLKKASEQGLPQAQYELGKLLVQAPGNIKRDKFEAYVWFLLASNGGHSSYPDLQSLETDLGTGLTNQAKAEARRREGQFDRAAVAHGCTGWDGEFDLVPTAPPPQIQRFCR